MPIAWHYINAVELGCAFRSPEPFSSSLSGWEGGRKVVANFIFLKGEREI